MRNKLEYNTAARCFEEALPIGNGSLGAMTDKKGIYATAGMSSDGKAMIISNYSCDDSEVEVSVNADESDIKAYVTTIDESFKGEYNTTDLTTADIGKIKLSIPKHTVAYIEFE